jgi:YbbR domain-containing protein
MARFLERLLEKDLGLKLLSVGLAVLLWFQATAASGPALPLTVRGVPVACRNLGPGLVLLSAPSAVDLAVRGQGEILRHVTKDNFTAYVDLKGAGLGQGSFPVRLESPEGTTVATVTPAEVRVDIDAWDTRQVPVSIYTLGSPAVDHAMKAQQARPTDLYVEGPRSSVQLVTRVIAKVDITGAMQDLSRTVVARPVNAEGAEVQGVTVTPAAVDVVISIVKLPPVREVTVRVNVQGKPAPGFVHEATEVSPQKVRVWAAGPLAEEIKYLWTYPIDIEGVSATVERNLLLLVPQGTEKVEPTSVRVSVVVAEVQEEREIKGVRIETLNLGQGLKVSLEPAEVTVVLRGPRSLVASLDAGQVVARADLAGLAAGRHEVTLSVFLPEGLVLKSASPAVASVVLEKL